MAKSIGIFLIIFSILIVMPIGNAGFQHIRRGQGKADKILVYLQDRFSGENQTVYDVARASITSESPTRFGLVQVADSPLTTTPDSNSQVVGRAQGQVIYSDFATPSLALSFNFIFTSGKYNGSTISIFGRNPLSNKERELSIIGGTGVFRLARGYALTRTIELNAIRGVLEYALYVTC